MSQSSPPATEKRATRWNPIWLLPMLLIGIFLVLLIIPLALPYIRPGHQIAHDRLVPFMRVDALYGAFKDLQIPPRWFPEFDGGYGSPYPSFYAMLFYYSAAALYALGLPLGSSVELTAFATLMLSGLTMYLFVSRYWGRASGLLSAILYVYAPYHLTDAFERGAYSELTAFIWPPLIVLGLVSCAESRNGRWIVLGGLSTALLIVSHNLTSLIFLSAMIPLALLIVAAEGLGADSVKRSLIGLSLSAGLGLALSAFFWLPIVSERSWIQLEYFLKFDYRGDFVSTRDLLSMPSDVHMATSAGVLLVLIPILALVAELIRSRGRRQMFLLLGLVTLGGGNLFMVTRHSLLIWKLLEPLKYVQFPWRFLSPASFFLAAAAGPLADLPGRSWTRWAVTAGIGILALHLYSPLARIQHRTEVQSLAPSEICSEVWGTQDYRPTWSLAAFWESVQPPQIDIVGPILPPCPVSPVFAPDDQVEVLEAEFEVVDQIAGRGNCLLSAFTVLLPHVEGFNR